MPLGNEFEVVIGADDKPLQNAVRRSSTSLKNLVTGIGVGVGASVFVGLSAAVSKFIGGAVDEFQEAQRSVESLRQSLEAIGREDVFARILQSSKDLQKQFKFLDDDDIVASFQKLIQVGGLTEDQVNRLIPVIAEFNAKQRLAGNVNKTLAQSTEDIIKGLSGSSRELKKYGIELSAAKTQGENLNIILAELPSKVQGAAAAFGGSLEGKLAATTTRVEELQEALGSRLLPFKAGLIAFALEAAQAFETLYQKLTGTFGVVQKAKKELDSLEASKKKAKEFAENATNFLSTADQENFEKFVNFYEKKIDDLSKTLAEKLEAHTGSNVDDFPTLKKQIQENRDLVDAIRERKRLLDDTSTLGKNTGKDAVGHKQVTDALKTRISALKELVSLGIDVKDNSFELKNLDIKLILRDAKSKGFTQEEADKIISQKYPEFSEGLRFSKPIEIFPPEFNVQKGISEFDAAGSDLAEAQTRMYGVVIKQAQENGAAAREAILAPLQNLQEDFKNILSGGLMSVGEAIGDSLAGAINPASAFIEIISGVLEQLGRALIAYGVAQKAFQNAIKLGAFGNPFIAIGAGVAAIAVGKLLRAQLRKDSKFAEGGIVMGPTRALIGESGPEAVIPLSRANQFNNSSQEIYLNGELSVMGNNLVLVLNRALANQSRRGGNG